MIGSMNVNGSKAEDYDITFNIGNGSSTSSIFSADDFMNWEVGIVLNEKITSLSKMFYQQQYIQGKVLLNCYATNYSQCFYSTCGINDGRELIVNYTAICTTIDNIIATKTNNYVKKGVLVV